MSPEIELFFEKAAAAGIPHESVAKVLIARGWPEKEVYEALAQHYQRLTGMELPHRTGVPVSAKDAFFYLLTFATLATWTVALGSLAFDLIDRWLADPLFNRYQLFSDSVSMTAALAAILVAFPFFLLISRAVARDTAQQPEKLDSPIRKWLTYMALVIAACIFMGDLIATLAQLLRGELTSRFILHSLTVLALSGGVFFYYFGGLRKSGALIARQRRDRLMAALSSVIVIVLLVLGFWQLGSPGKQREFRVDAQRVQQLFQLSSQIRDYWSAHQSQLPATLDQLNQLSSTSRRDPVSGALYEYRPGAGSQYQLCATFAQPGPPETPGRPDPWTHPAGHRCFLLDASAIPQFSPYPAAYGTQP